MTTRRKFIKSTGTAVAGACLCGAAISDCGMIRGTSKTPIAPLNSVVRKDNEYILDLNLLPSLNNVGGSVRFAYINREEKKREVIVVHHEQNQYLAFNNGCTHGGRPVDYDPVKKQLRCVSIGHSKFDLKGEVLKGPAKRPLDKFDVHQQRTKLIVTIA